MSISTKWQSRLMLAVLLSMACAVALVFAARAVVSGNQAPTAEFLAAALADQELASGASLQVGYVCEAPGDPQAGEGRAEMRYVRTRTALLLEEKLEKYAASGTWECTFLNQHGYERDSRDYKRLTPPPPRAPADAPIEGMHLTCHGPGGAFSILNVLETTLYPIGGLPLIDALNLGRVADSQEIVDGKACWKAEIAMQDIAAALTAAGSNVSAPDDVRYIVWLDPSVGFCPRQITMLKEDDSSKDRTIRFLDYREVRSGFWFPMRNEIWAGPGVEKLTSVSKVVHIQAGEELPKDKVVISFPPGTRLVRDGEQVVIP